MVILLKKCVYTCIFIFNMHIYTYVYFVVISIKFECPTIQGSRVQDHCLHECSGRALSAQRNLTYLHFEAMLLYQQAACVVSVVVLGRLPHVLGDGSCKLSCRLWSLGGCHTFWAMDHVSCRVGCGPWECHTFWAMDHVSCRVSCGRWEVATRFVRWIM